MKKKLVAIKPAIFLSLLLTCLPLQSNTLADDVDLRIETFDEIDRLFKAVRFKVVNMRSEDHQGARVYSEALVRHAYRLPGLFEEESPREAFRQSSARPQIWQRKERYDYLMNEFIDNLEEIHELLEQEQMTAAGRQIDLTAQSCRRCHNTFRYR